MSSYLFCLISLDTPSFYIKARKCPKNHVTGPHFPKAKESQSHSDLGLAGIPPLYPARALYQAGWALK